tara:strand:- start:6923 stop:7324 length:402 start_codon:yes stop_codon:yes gene_type:complete
MYEQSSLFDANSIAILKSEKHGQIVTKTCKTCGETKPDSEFEKADGRHRATRNRCKVCFKKQAILRRKLRKENPPPAPGVCPICNEETTAWVLDHCHSTETFRGYVCRTCNAGIGLLHDDIEVLNRAVNYLTK